MTRKAVAGGCVRDADNKAVLSVPGNAPSGSNSAASALSPLSMALAGVWRLLRGASGPDAKGHGRTVC
jgi:hypothetical protein